VSVGQALNSRSCAIEQIGYDGCYMYFTPLSKLCCEINCNIFDSRKFNQNSLNKILYLHNGKVATWFPHGDEGLIYTIGSLRRRYVSYKTHREQRFSKCLNTLHPDTEFKKLKVRKAILPHIFYGDHYEPIWSVKSPRINYKYYYIILRVHLPKDLVFIILRSLSILQKYN
jgi:hypothetical protein